MTSLSIPLAVAVPAATAAAAYINAKAHVWYDLKMLKCAAPMAIQMMWRERTGKLSLFYDLEYWAHNSKTADTPFLLFEDRSWTYRQALEQALKHGTWLRETFGIKKDDIVAMDFTNSDTFVFVWLGLWAVGAKPAFINYNLAGPALIHCARAAGAAIMLVDPAVAHNVDDFVRRELAGVRLEVFSAEHRQQVAATTPVRLPDEQRADEGVYSMANLIYTSGTTGLPKAAVVSWGKMHAAGGFSARLIGSRPGEIFYTCMPLYHSSGAILCIANVLLSGATVALGSKFSTHTFWSEVRRHDATMIQYVGETLRYLLTAPVDKDPVTGENLDKRHRVRVALGNGLRPDVWNKFKQRFGVEYIAEFYGATEGSFATWNLSRNDFSMGAVGRSGWIYSVFVGSGTVLVEVDFTTDLPRRDPKTGFCKVTKPGQPGEFLFKLPEKELEKRFQGYYGDRAATNKKILRDVFKKGDAWFRTGDVMRWDDEGRIFFHDRIGDTFRWKSENVSTAEVSQALGHHPAIHEANVYGVQVPHHDGRAGCAAIVLNEGVLTKTANAMPEVLSSLGEHIRKALPKYAAPVFLRITQPGKMQTTGTNKQQKQDLRAGGVDPDKADGDELYWLQGGKYVPFTKREWEAVEGGRVKL
ncbi:acetyl-CoA synthetase-like protein [Cryphonectria parasitica EP155]|uniref:Very long-chain fatty acid transport protein n=1 Tax=Cryphonectria parasitica (strain ATCC 38755 / EP155) TaxID=660469 RepID=A0A9P4XWM9_CRYP1|nr:acetyl-CoA synthetase-like protein [Cryphonectria parasitica EP155]KAF3762177.1 acetyl-CoA synthetase-like protein [Cryphonectria parasitica EP155]